MGMFNKLFGKIHNGSNNRNLNANETIKEFIGKLSIDSSQTSDKFQNYIDEIIDLLISKLFAIHLLEKEIFERSLALKNPKEPNQIQPGEEELWDEYARRCEELIDPISLNTSKESSRSFGKPTKYEYLTYPNTRIVFTMKSVNRAVIETYYESGVNCKEQFVLRKDGINWKIDTKKYGFQGENKWYKDIL